MVAGAFGGGVVAGSNRCLLHLPADYGDWRGEAGKACGYRDRALEPRTSAEGRSDRSSVRRAVGLALRIGLDA